MKKVITLSTNSYTDGLNKISNALYEVFSQEEIQKKLRVITEDHKIVAVQLTFDASLKTSKPTLKERFKSWQKEFMLSHDNLTQGFYGDIKRKSDLEEPFLD